jgi:hypothetical protein
MRVRGGGVKALSPFRDPIPPEPAATAHLWVHNPTMDDVVYMVRGRTQEVCQRELDRICQLLGAIPTTLPTDAVGRGWTARAVPTPHPEPAPE